MSRARHVVAVVVQHRGKIALFRRARREAHDAGLWHCITGFLDAGNSPEQQVYEELGEETGLNAEDLIDFTTGPLLQLDDERGIRWVIHTFVVETLRRRLVLDWEHDAYRWTAIPKTMRFCNRVSWLDEVLEATGLTNRKHESQPAGEPRQLIREGLIR